MNYGNVDKPHILLYNVNFDGEYSQWIIYQTPDSSLCSINPCKYIFESLSKIQVFLQRRGFVCYFLNIDCYAALSFTSEFVGSILATDSCEKSLSTL